MIKNWDFLMKSTSWVILALVASLHIGLANNAHAITSHAEGLETVSLPNLVAIADDKDADQLLARESWQEIVNHGTADDLPMILAAMKDAGPLGQNWLRAAADTVAERELKQTGTLQAQPLEAFVLNSQHSPRGRRVAYEWLTKLDEDAPSRLLPKMLDDVSLELRYDAIARLLAEAENASDDDIKLQKYLRAFQSVRDKTQFQQCADALKSLGQTPDMAGQLGFLTKWKVVGPFDNTDRKGFNTIHMAADKVDLADEYTGKQGPVRWKDAFAEQGDSESLGMVDLNAALVEEKSVLAYALTKFESANAQSVECRYESKSATKLWINGKEVVVKNVYHSGGGFDQYIVPCEFKAGPNQILIKVCQNEQTEPWTKPWEFRLRVTDNLGGAVQQAN